VLHTASGLTFCGELAAGSTAGTSERHIRVRLEATGARREDASLSVVGEEGIQSYYSIVRAGRW
jgi:hypothetical protein